jgi:hypothetical protein
MRESLLANQLKMKGTLLEFGLVCVLANKNMLSLHQSDAKDRGAQTEFHRHSTSTTPSKRPKREKQGGENCGHKPTFEDTILPKKQELCHPLRN